MYINQQCLKDIGHKSREIYWEKLNTCEGTQHATNHHWLNPLE